MFTKEDLDKIKAQVSIVNLLTKHNVELERAGVNYKALCPLPDHSERSPSFHVKEDTNTYHCFGCGESGDIFSLEQAITSVNFRESVQSIIELFNLDVKETNVKGQPERSKLKPVKDALTYASQWYSKRLFDKTENAKKARDILKDRNLLDYDLLEEYGIGYAPGGDSLYKEMTSNKFNTDVLIEAGLIKKDEDSGRYRDVFNNRLLWTIADKYGKVSGFGGRRIFDDNKKIPKYLNSSDTIAYNKSKTLWALNVASSTARETGELFIVEGYTDVMALNKSGFKNAVAPCGTAFTLEQGKLVSSLRVKPIKAVFVFDADEAGQKAARKVFSDGLYDLRYSYVIIPKTSKGEYVDPCDFMIKEGADSLNTFLTSDSNRMSLVEFVLKNEALSYDFNKIEDRSIYVDNAVQLLNSIEEVSLRVEYSRVIAREAGWKIDDVSSLIDKRKTKIKEPSANNEIETPKAKYDKKINVEESFIASLIQFPISAWNFVEKHSMGYLPNEENFDDEEVKDIYSILKIVLPTLKEEAGEAIEDDDVNYPKTLNKLRLLPFTGNSGITEFEDGNKETLLLLENLCARVKTLHKRRSKNTPLDLLKDFE